MPTFHSPDRNGSRTWKIYFRTFVPDAPGHAALETATATADSVVVTASGDLVGHSGVGNGRGNGRGNGMGNGMNIPVFCYAKGVWESCHLQRSQ